MIEVRLTWAEAELAAYAGMKRRLLALHDSRPGFYGFKEDDGWGSDVESAGAELAVATATGLAWVAWARRPSEVQADVGDDVQVRSTRRGNGHMLIHEADRDDHRFVLVFGSIPSYRIAGWISGGAGKDPEFWGDPFGTERPCFWVPPDRLEPLETLECPRQERAAA